MSNGKARGPLRYHGGKQRLGGWIASHFPPHRVYLEAFAGGAGVLFAKERSEREVYNDLDGEVVNFFKVLRDRPCDLADAVALTPYSRQEFLEAHKPTRNRLERARRFAVLSHMGFGSSACTKHGTSGFRSNVTRTATCPAMDWAKLPPILQRCAERIQEVTVENQAAIAVINRLDAPDTLVYADPPYLPSTRRKGSERYRDAYRHEMSEEDHIALLKRLRSFTGHVVLSGYPSELYDDLLCGWNRVEKIANASGNEGGAVRVEALWIKPHSGSLFAQGGAAR